MQARRTWRRGKPWALRWSAENTPGVEVGDKARFNLTCLTTVFPVHLARRIAQPGAMDSAGCSPAPASSHLCSLHKLAAVAEGNDTYRAALAGRSSKGKIGAPRACTGPSRLPLAAGAFSNISGMGNVVPRTQFIRDCLADADAAPRFRLVAESKTLLDMRGLSTGRRDADEAEV